MRWKVRKIIGRVVSGTPILELRIDGITDRAKPTQDSLLTVQNIITLLHYKSSEGVGITELRNKGIESIEGIEKLLTTKLNTRAAPLVGLWTRSLVVCEALAKHKKSLWCRYDFFSSCVMPYIYI